MKKKLLCLLNICLIILLVGCNSTTNNNVEEEDVTTPDEVIYYFDAGYHNPIIASNNTVSYSKIYYGEYPQTLVEDEDILTALNQVVDGGEVSPDKYGYYTYQGLRYLLMSTYTREIVEGIQVLVETREFYLVDSIEWRILSINGEKATLLSEKILDSKSFYNNSLIAVGETKNIYTGANNMNMLLSTWTSSNEDIASVSKDVDTLVATVGVDNNWWISGKNTLVPVGDDTSADLEINENGYWVINGVVSSLKAFINIMLTASKTGEVTITGTAPAKENSEEIITVEYKFVVVAANDKTWKNSYLRHWLNNDFYKAAFSASEKANIVETNVSNQGVSYMPYQTGEGQDTIDQVYLLSYNDLLRKKYGFSNKPDIADPAKSALNTEFAIKTGAENSDDNKGKWFSRSPGLNMQYLSGVFFDGKLSASGFNNAYSNIGVRPVITIMFEK